MGHLLSCAIIISRVRGVWIEFSGGGGWRGTARICFKGVPKLTCDIISSVGNVVTVYGSSDSRGQPPSSRRVENCARFFFFFPESGLVSYVIGVVCLVSLYDLIGLYFRRKVSDV